MGNEKILKVMAEVNSAVCEREELVRCIALCLLTGRNLFVLGDVGQAKSYAIDQFCSRITGAKQFSTLMSKQTDEEQLFGRLDLASLIPGHVPKSVTESDPTYRQMRSDLEKALEDFRKDPGNVNLAEAVKKEQEALEIYEKGLAASRGGRPEYITAGKIPDSHICFIDELFKSNEGVLNSLLKALNERVYTNEGRTEKIPVISFFSASNEIPDFRNPEEKILKALYDRFDLKVKTEYVKEKSNRMAMLRHKQQNGVESVNAYISLTELEEMQKEVKNVKIPDSINEIMDAVLLELRKKDIAVSDRSFFGFGSIVQAEAFLNGRDEVIPKDMLVLKNYLWNKPEEISTVSQILERLCENPIGDRIKELTAKALAARDEFNSSSDRNRALIKLKTDLLTLYDESTAIKDNLPDGDAAISGADSFIGTLEDISRDAYSKTGFTYVSLPELKAYQNLQI